MMDAGVAFMGSEPPSAAEARTVARGEMNELDNLLPLSIILYS